MKVRTGFVSNSSSSSFVIALDAMPESVAELQALLFGDKLGYEHPYDDTGFVTQVVASQIFDRLSDKKPLSFNELVEEFSCGWLFWDQLEKEFPHKYTGTPEENQALYEKRDERNQELAREFATEFINKPEVTGKLLFEVEFSDNDSSIDSAIEHGTAFDAFPNVKISHH